MKEIASDVFIEQNSLGIYTGIIQSESGMLLIDSPLRPLKVDYGKAVQSRVGIANIVTW